MFNRINLNHDLANYQAKWFLIKQLLAVLNSKKTANTHIKTTQMNTKLSDRDYN